jgi:hypothetical protein
MPTLLLSAPELLRHGNPPLLRAAHMDMSVPLPTIYGLPQLLFVDRQ